MTLPAASAEEGSAEKLSGNAMRQMIVTSWTSVGAKIVLVRVRIQKFPSESSSLQQDSYRDFCLMLGRNLCEFDCVLDTDCKDFYCNKALGYMCKYVSGNLFGFIIIFFKVWEQLVCLQEEDNRM